MKASIYYINLHVVPWYRGGIFSASGTMEYLKCGSGGIRTHALSALPEKVHIVT